MQSSVLSIISRTPFKQKVNDAPDRFANIELEEEANKEATGCKRRDKEEEEGRRHSSD